VKQFKTSLEKGSKLSRAFKKELAASEELTTDVHAELVRRESAKITKDVDSELSWIKVSDFEHFRHCHHRGCHLREVFTWSK